MVEFGKMNELNADAEDWVQHMERLGQYLIANDIEDADRQWAVLLRASQTYGLMRSLVSPTKPCLI